ncbi:hypothetical protein XA68_12841 [Ophiocordyceps unilateralis]|uniref:Uncharacterized protein n=1 Tax=Ophiocordyceps unilateralis TaxID=268505 RepID=A0A2A9P1Z9_OPHUN|nr:hypothetical protein XA68_12841 [Ophiocordyceps unilateralis]
MLPNIGLVLLSALALSPTTIFASPVRGMYLQNRNRPSTSQTQQGADAGGGSGSYPGGLAGARPDDSRPAGAPPPYSQNPKAAPGIPPPPYSKNAQDYANAPANGRPRTDQLPPPNYSEEVPRGSTRMNPC